MSARDDYPFFRSTIHGLGETVLSTKAYQDAMSEIDRLRAEADIRLSQVEHLHARLTDAEGARHMTITGAHKPGEPDDTVRPFHELRDTGLLWLINATVFHPRGYALGLQMRDDGTASGWRILGDGSEPWHYDQSVHADIDALFAKIKELLP